MFVGEREGGCYLNCRVRAALSSLSLSLSSLSLSLLSLSFLRKTRRLISLSPLKNCRNISAFFSKGGGGNCKGEREGEKLSSPSSSLYYTHVTEEALYVRCGREEEEGTVKHMGQSVCVGQRKRKTCVHYCAPDFTAHYCRPGQNP